MAGSKFAFFAFFAFLDAAYQVLPYLRTTDVRACGDCDRRNFQVSAELARGRIVELSTRICNVMDGMGVAWLVDGARHFADLSVMPLFHMSACDWDKIAANHWYFDYSSG